MPAGGEPFRAGSFDPAVSLTEDLPQGADADILLLGGGDIRHIFHTAHTETFLPPRKLDITSCDVDENAIGKTSSLSAQLSVPRILDVTNTLQRGISCSLASSWTVPSPALSPLRICGTSTTTSTSTRATSS